MGGNYIFLTLGLAARKPVEMRRGRRWRRCMVTEGCQGCQGCKVVRGVRGARVWYCPKEQESTVEVRSTAL